MKTRLLLSCLLAPLFLSLGLQAQDRDVAADQEAIRQAIVGYVAAINQGDARAASNFWSETGEWIAPDGKRIVGRSEIEKELANMFAAGAGPQLELLDINVRFLSANVATEEGEAVVTRDEELPVRSTYISIHVRTDDGWKLDSVRETILPRPDSNHEHLRELEWMIGTWLDADDNSSVETSCDWTANRNFMLRTFRVKFGDELGLEGTQVVGWDAANQQIRSWVFDSDGGFGEGVWTREGNTWIVDSSFQLADGSAGRAINRYTYLNPQSFTFASTDREIDGEALPDVDEVTINRVANTDD